MFSCNRILNMFRRINNMHHLILWTFPKEKESFYITIHTLNYSKYALEYENLLYKYGMSILIYVVPYCLEKKLLKTSQYIKNLMGRFIGCISSINKNWERVHKYKAISFFRENHSEIRCKTKMKAPTTRH